jgi:hypothetical protein
MTRVAHFSLPDLPPPLLREPPPSPDAARVLALATIIPNFTRKPRAHYGRILLGPQHLPAVAQLYRLREIGAFGGFLTFAITGVKPRSFQGKN